MNKISFLQIIISFTLISLTSCGNSCSSSSSSESFGEESFSDESVSEEEKDSEQVFDPTNPNISEKEPTAPPVNEDFFHENRLARLDQFLNIQSWAIQYQNMNHDEIVQSKYDLIAIDYSKDGSDPQAYTKADILEMKSDGESKKLILSYLSASEAENFRYYFDPEASFLDIENPAWPGNFKVLYWMEEWQKILESYLDRIIAAGFDGVYLDIVDSFEYYGPGGLSGLERETAAQDMESLITRMANYARQIDEEFLFVILTTSKITDHFTQDSVLFDSIDGIGVAYNTEFVTTDETTTNESQSNLEKDSPPSLLDSFVLSEKPVLALGYFTVPEDIDLFYEESHAEGYIPYCTNRFLDQLTINAGHEPE